MAARNANVRDNSLPFGLTRSAFLAIVVVSVLLHTSHGIGGEFIIGFGANDTGQITVPALSGTPGEIESGFNHSLVANSGNVLAWGDNALGQANVPGGITNVSGVSAGHRHSLVLLGDGLVLAWGDNAFGQCDVPTNLSGTIAVAAGGFHSLALDQAGAVRAWGQGTYGQTSVSTTATNIKAIAAGAYHSVALRSNGSLVAWGFNGNGQVSVPAGLPDVARVASGFYHNLALRSNGMVRAWGWNQSGQINVPASLSNVVSVAAGLTHSVALRADGRVVSWGDNAAGQLVNPDDAANVTAIAAGANFTILRTRGPVVTQHPVGAILSVGTNLTLSAAGVADAPLLFQWEKDGIAIANATNATFSLVNAQAADAGYYRCQIINSNGVAFTRNALVAHPPGFTAQPQPTQIYYGSNTVMSVAVVGVPTPQLQWRFNGNALAGATNGTLSITNATYAVDGNYSVIASNSAGSITSQVARLYVRSQPTLTAVAYQDPGYGGRAALETRAAGVGPDSIQWQFNNQDIPGATNNLVLEPLRPAHAGVYRFIGWTPAGPVYSSGVTITVARANPVQFVGRTIVLEAGDGNGTVRYWQWRRNGVDVPGGTNAILVLAALQTSDGGDYTVAVTDALTQRELPAARLTVLPEPPPGVPVAWGLGAPTVPTNGDFVSIEAGSSHGLLLRADGSVVGFGNTGCSAITIPASVSNVVAISAGIYNSMALRSDGKAMSFGNCSCSACGSVIERAVSISMGAWHGVALLNDGTVGFAGESQYALPAGLSNIVAVAAGYEHSLALKSDGTVIMGGNNGGGLQTVPAGLNSVKAIAVGNAHNLAVKSNGTVVAWGSNASGQCNVPAGLSNVVAVRAGGNISLAIKADASVVVWGINDLGQTNLPAGLTNVLDYGGGDSFGVALLGGLDRPAILKSPQNSTNAIGSSATFTVLARSSAPLSYQWRYSGTDLIGATNSSLELTNVTPADAGFYSVVVSTVAGSCDSKAAYLYVIPAPFLPFPSGTPGRVIAWGRNFYGESTVPADLTNAVAISSGSGSLDTYAFRADGRIACWGGGVGLPARLTNLVSVFGAPNYAFGLNANGTVETWGSSDYTALQPGIIGVQAISAGAVKLVLYTNGVVETADNGTLLNGASNVIAIAVGGGHALALHNDGTIKLDKWNYLYSEQTDPPANWSNVVAVAAGQHHSLVLLSDGTVVAWGRNAESQCSVPPGLSNVIAIAASGNHSLALKSDRSVVTWGDSAYELDQPPAGLTNVVAIACGWVHSVAIQAGPVFTLIPTNIVSGMGSNVTFQAAATANSPVNFQWFLNGNPIVGATNSHITLTNVQPQDTGAYLVRAESDGFAVNASARLSLGDAIAVLQKPSDLWVMPADAAVFQVSASNSLPVFYQWAHGTQLLAGETNSVLVLTNVQSQQAGNYSVRIYNSVGMETNLSATLFVLSTQAMGKVVSWGSTTNVPAWLSGVIEIAAGGNTSLALRADGTVVSWGDNSYGQTNVPTGLRDVVAISAGGGHSLALKQDGTIVGWGYNYNGQASPPGISGARSMAAGASFSAAVDQNGGILSWGNGSGGVLSVPAGLVNGMRVAAGDSHGLVLKSDGTVVGWGDDTYGQSSTASNFTDVAAIAAGHYHSMVLKSNGTVAAFGFNFAGQTDVPVGLSNVTDIAVGYARCLVVRADGLITGWGLNDEGRAQSPVGLSNVVKVAAGSYHSLALRETGCFIWRPPTNTTVLAGSNGVLRVGATGVAPLTYQWRFKDVDIPLATNPVLSLQDVQFTNGGSYSVFVTSARGSEESATATLTVLSPPIFTTHPASQAAYHGSNVFFSVTVTGTPPLSLRWQRNGTNLVNATSSSLSLSNVTLANAGEYRVLATNVYGRATSEVATLTVKVGPTILAPPTNQVVVLGSNALFAVNANGSLPLSYQWLTDGDPIPGATNASLPIVGVQTNNAGNYSARVTNTFGAVTSSPAMLTVVSISPTILTQPADMNARFGDNVGFSVIATGASPLSYQWSFNGTNIPGATAASLTISNVNLANEGGYQALVSNAAGTATSESASLTLRLPPNVIAWGSNNVGQINVPDDLTNAIAIAAGDSHNLAVREDGDVVAWGNNNYGQCNVPNGLTNVVAVAAGQRQSLALLSSGSAVGWGATNSYGEATPPVLATNVMAIEAGYLHSLVLQSNGTVVGWGYNVYGQATAPASLSNVMAVTAGFDHSVALHSNGTVTGWGNYYGEPIGLSNVVAVAGSIFEFLALQSNGQVVSWGPGNYGQLKYAGPSNAIAISGGGSSVTISSGGTTTVYRPHFLAILTNGLPYIWGTNPAGIYTPPSTLLNVTAIASGFSHNLALVRAPLIILSPESQTVNEGETVVLRVRTARSDSAQFQWRFNGLPLAGATNSDLVLSQVQFLDAGTYTVSVRNRFGLVTSIPAQLTVLPRLPVITGQPASTAVAEGSNASFLVSATGMGVLNYQWLFNNTLIPGANSSALVVSNVSAANCGQYAVVVANDQGFMLSSNAVLTLATGELILDNPGASVTGAWIESLATSRYGTNSLLKGQGFGDASVRFSGVVPRTGIYQVYEWHSAVSNRATAVPFRVTHSGGETLVTVNQSLNAGVWRPIGAFPFATTTSANITVSDGFPNAGMVVVADAVRFVYVPSPPEILVPPQSEVVSSGASVTLGVIAGGAGPLAYQWRKNGVNIPQATNDSISLTGIQHWDAGAYAVLVTGRDGVALSQPAMLTVTAPALATRLSTQGFVIEWTGAGVLQTSTNVTGPYVDLPAAESPFTNSVFLDQQRFFRLRSSSFGPSVTFQSHASLTLTWPNSGMLQTATNVNGPYVDIPWAQSPFINNLPATPERYFRLRY